MDVRGLDLCVPVRTEVAHRSQRSHSLCAHEAGIAQRVCAQKEIIDRPTLICISCAGAAHTADSANAHSLSEYVSMAHKYHVGLTEIHSTHLP